VAHGGCDAMDRHTAGNRNSRDQNKDLPRSGPCLNLTGPPYSVFLRGFPLSFRLGL